MKPVKMNLARSIVEFGHAYIIHTLEVFSHNRTRTAQALGMSRSTLMRKMSLYDIE